MVGIVSSSFLWGRFLFSMPICLSRTGLRCLNGPFVLHPKILVPAMLLWKDHARTQASLPNKIYLESQGHFVSESTRRTTGVTTWLIGLINRLTKSMNVPLSPAKAHTFRLEAPTQPEITVPRLSETSSFSHPSHITYYAAAMVCRAPEKELQLGHPYRETPWFLYVQNMVT